MFPVLQILNYRLYLKEFMIVFFCFLLTEGIFSWLFIQNSNITVTYVKVLSIGIYAIVLLYYRNLKLMEKICVSVFSFIMIKLVFESMLEFGTPFKYLEIFSVLFPVIFTIFISSTLRRFDIDLLEFVANFYLITYLVFMVLFGRGFSLGLEYIDMDDYGPYSGDTRIIHAQSIFMIIIPYLYYLHKYIFTKKTQFFLLFVFCLLIIVMHQHRSVWSSAIFATMAYFMIAIRNSLKAISGTYKFIIVSSFMITVALIVISNINPEILSYFSDRFSEIVNPSKDEGTGSFRIEQSLTYYNYIIERPIFGWTFEGYELPNPLVDWWEPGTGQHFHEGYIEILFYHGLLGFILKYGVLLYLGYKAFSRRLPENAVILIPFCVCGLIFSLSYILPLVFWGAAGMCLYYLERKQSGNGMKLLERLRPVTRQNLQETIA